VADRSERVVVWAPRGRDGVLACQLIERHGLMAEQISNVGQLASSVVDAGCAVVSAEALGARERQELGVALATQPPWSDFPIILSAARGTGGVDRSDEVQLAVHELGNVTILERPVQSRSLVSAVIAALRGRRRQYEARDAIVRREQFLAMLGHELRNPLAAITLAIDMLPKGEGERAERQRAILERQSRHLGRLVDDLLDVARVTTGKVQIKPEPLDLADVVRRSVQGAELAARARGIALHAELGEMPLPIQGDLVRLEEIFNNLISNAIKYSLSGATVTVSAFRLDDHCMIEVTDTGIGLAPDMVDRVFDLFVQADTSLDRSQGGLGIGLTLVRALVELHHGKITARSPGLGKGTTFIVELPLAQSVAPATAPPRLVAVEDPLHRTVLLIEDNADLLETTKDLLEALGCIVECATDGSEGLKNLVAAPPDIAFVDIGLPGLDGYTIAARARAHGVRSYLVAISGYGQVEDRERALASGFNEHLTKPVSRAVLVATLRARARAGSATKAVG
jgi:signal transduction histidine kinase/ActR/RegA family two-component response regulator